MQVQESYDLIVIGDQLSGLFLAAGAAQKGERVLVLEEASVPTVSYETPSGKFLGDFAAQPVIGLRKGTPVDAFLQSLGLYQDLDDLFPVHEPALQVVGKTTRFDFQYAPEALLPELQREFPSTSPSVHRLLSGLATSKGSFPNVVGDVGLPVKFETFGWMQSALYGSLASPELSFAGYKDVLQLASHSVRYVLGGRSALKERLLSRIVLSGGTIKRATRVEEIVFERGKLAGVLLSSYEGFVRAKMVVGAMGAQEFYRMIPKEFRQSRLTEAVEGIRPRFWRLSFTLLVPEGILPEGMGSHVALLNEGQDDFLQLQVFPKDAYGGVPAGHKVVIARALVPFAASNLSSLAVSRHLKRSVQRIREVIPFLPDDVSAISPNPDRLADDQAYAKHYVFPSLADIPPLFLAYEKVLSEAQDQRDFLDWSRFGLPGLALCSTDIYPLFGATGEILAAMDLLAVRAKARPRP